MRDDPKTNFQRLQAKLPLILLKQRTLLRDEAPRDNLPRRQ